MHKHKETLRNQLRAGRQALNTEEVTSLSKRIAHRAIDAIEWASITNLHIYQPIPQQREIDTTPLLQMIRRQYPGIQTATWQKTPDGHMSFWLDTAGIRGPVPAGQQFSAIVVPLLGFNDDRHRIGFGGGFYDRFLATQLNAVTLGLCYEFGYAATFCPEAHDVPLTHIVTEKRVYCQRR